MKKYFQLLVAIIISSALPANALAKNNNYIIYIDAGSTGSRLHIFQYEKSLSVPTIKDVFSVNIKPGLSEYADHPESSGHSLKKLFDDAAKFLLDQGADLRAVPVNLFATAGMRLLTEDKQQAIYLDVSNFIRNNYEFTIRDIKTISGKMEGFYGWLDINYLLENLQNHRATVGSIDMGGASTQIAFATKDTSKPDDEVSLNIDNQHYRVFSKSFLGLGQDQARDIMLIDQASSHCFPKNYVVNNVNIGNFNMLSCGSIYDKILKNQKASELLIPTQGESFVAYSGIYFSYNFFNVDKTPDQTSLETQIQNVCTQTWEQLQNDYPKVPEKYLSTYCANGVYHSKLIYDTYKIQGHQLTVANQINQKDIDWTLGAALYDLIQ